MANTHETVAADYNQIVRVTEAFLAGKDGIAQAEQLLVSAKRGHLDLIQTACDGVKAVNEEAWDEYWRKIVRDHLEKSGLSKSSIPVTESNIKVAVIAITNGITPKSDDTFTSFVKWAREECRAGEYIKAKKGAGRPKGDGETKVTHKPSPRMQAIELLARGGDQELPDEQVSHRVGVLSFLLSQDGIWEELARLEHQYRQKLNKPKALAA